MVIGIQIGETGGVAVYEEGNIIYAASEERFSRRKNDSSFPYMAIQNAIQTCSIKPEKIEKAVIASGWGWSEKILTDYSSYSIEDWVKEENEYWWPVFYENRQVDYLEVFKEKVEKTKYKDLLEEIRNADDKEVIYHSWIKRMIANALNIDKEKVELVSHEFAHAAYGYYGSRFDCLDDVMAVVYDGWGDESNASIYVMEQGRIRQVKKYANYNIGRVYRYMTLLLGMKPLEHEYKVMGLAPYATEYTYRKPLEVFRAAYDFVNGTVVSDPEMKDSYFYFKKKLEGMRFDGIAAGLQIFTEEMNKKLINHWMSKTGKKKLVLSGGVSLNVKANYEVGKLDCVDELFVPGSAGDESQCIGAIFAYLDMHGRGNEIKKLSSMYLGSDVEKTDVEETLKEAERKGYVVEKGVTNERIAEKLFEGLILGRVAGKMEFGARALGNRSILADPRDREIVARINSKIKNRDFWMPFTPSILDEDEKTYLCNPKGFSYPYMTVACATSNQGKKFLPAAIHPADLTARPQIVTESDNKEYYDLIKAFKKLSGVGGLLNTSLNLHGYPIVRTASEAFYVLENSDLDGLVVKDNLILRCR